MVVGCLLADNYCSQSRNHNNKCVCVCVCGYVCFFFRISFPIPSSVFTNDAMVLMANGFHTTILQRETIQESVLDLLAFPNTVPVRGAPFQLQGYKFKQIYIYCSGRGPS
jgi:hypothetical protein